VWPGFYVYIVARLPSAEVVALVEQIRESALALYTGEGRKISERSDAVRG